MARWPITVRRSHLILLMQQAFTVDEVIFAKREATSPAPSPTTNTHFRLLSILMIRRSWTRRKRRPRPVRRRLLSHNRASRLCKTYNLLTKTKMKLLPSPWQWHLSRHTQERMLIRSPAFTLTVSIIRIAV